MAVSRFPSLILSLLVLTFVGCGPAPKRATSGNPVSGGNLPPGGGGTLPVSPLASSFLNVDVLKKDGTPFSRAKVSILNSSFEGETSEQGTLSLPLSEISGRVVSLKIIFPAPLNLNFTEDNRAILSDVELPIDILDSINFVRSKVGVAPLEGTTLPSGVDPAAAVGGIPSLLERKLALQMPENLPQPTVSESGELILTKQRIVVSSFPTKPPEAGKQFGLWTKVENRSNSNSARFVWSNPFAESAGVKIAYAREELPITLWDGSALTLPVWSGRDVGTNLVTEFSGCTDAEFSGGGSGALSTVSLTGCGFLRSQFPFDTGTDVYVRFMTESATEIRMSQVFKISAGGNAPVLSSVSGQSVRISAVLSDVKISLIDDDSSLNCIDALAVSSSNTALLSNNSITIGGTAPECVLSMTPVSGVSGSTDITVVASDGSLTSSIQFNVVVSETNLRPKISDLLNTSSPTSTDEDTMSLPIFLTIEDADGPQQSCSGLFLSYESWTPTLVAPSGAVTWGGAWPFCHAKVTPMADASGDAILMFYAKDGKNTSDALSYSLRVNAVNDAPFIEKIGIKTTKEDEPISPFSIVVSDKEQQLNCGAANSVSPSISVTASSNSQLIPVEGIVLSGEFPNCMMSISPVPDKHGESLVSIRVKDGELDTSLATIETFLVKVTSVNDEPIFDAISNQQTAEDTEKTIDVVVNDADGPLSCSNGLRVFTNSNQLLFSNNKIVFSGVTPICKATFSPELNQSGAAQLKFIFNDGFVAKYSNQFDFSVTPVNDAPSVAAIGAQSTNEDTATIAIPVTITDVDGPVRMCNGSYLFYSSNTGGVVATSGAVTWGGTWPSCTAVVTPVPNASGSSTMGFSASDGSLTSVVQSFVLTVNAVNDGPVVSAITTPQTTNEDTPTSAIAVTISDVDGPSRICNSTYLSYTSATTSVVPTSAGVTWGGAWPNCTAVVTPVANASGSSVLTITADDGTTKSAPQSFTLTVISVPDAPTISDVGLQETNEDVAKTVTFTIGDGDGPLQCASAVTRNSSHIELLPVANLTIGGTYPNCTISMSPVLNQTGSSTITLTVSDGQLTAQDTFTLTVNPVNDAPTISSLSPLSTNEDTASSAINLSISDVDGPPQTCSGSFLSYTSSNSSVVADSGAVTWGGLWPNCTAVVAPFSNGNGTSTLAFRATDGTTQGAVSSFVLTVNAMPDPPTISDVGDQSTSEDVAKSVSFTINDVDGPLQCVTAVARSSSNTVLLPVANLSISGTYPTCTINMNPALNQSGTSTITLTVSDGVASASDTFVLNVSAVNDPPTISNIDDKVTTEDVALNNVPFTVGDVEGTLTGCGTSVVAWSSNTSLLPVANISLNGTLPNCFVSLVPTLNNNGSVTVTLTLSDGALSSSDSFVLTVTAFNDAPTIVAITPKSTNEDTNTSAIAVSINDVDGPTRVCNETYLAYTSETASVVAATGAVTWGGTWPSCTAIITPSAQQSGSSLISITASDGALTSVAQSFTLSVNAVNDAPTVTLPSSVSLLQGSTVSVNATIGDVDNTVACSGLDFASSNTGLLPVANIAKSGTGLNCVITFSPVANSKGNAVVTVNLADGVGGTASRTITVQVLGLWQQDAYIKASHADAGDLFGTAVALYGDTLVVGAREDSNQSTITTSTSADNSLVDSGAVYVYRRNSTTSAWALEAFIKASTGAVAGGDLFGQSVALSGDSLAVGVPFEDSNQKTITSAAATSDSSQGLDSGAVFVFRRTGTTWAQDAFIKASNANSSDNFGTNLALFADTLAVGVRSEDSNQITITQFGPGGNNYGVLDSGATFIFQRSGAASPWWSQEAYLKASNSESYDSFGYSVSVSADSVAVGAQKEDSNQTTITTTGSASNASLDSGAVYLYRRTQGTSPFWTMEAYLKASNTAATSETNGTGGDLFGSSVAIHGDTVAVGAPQEDANVTTITNGGTSSSDNTSADSGAVYVYNRNGTAWTQQAYIKAANSNSNDLFGSSVDISGGTLVVGSPKEDSSASTVTIGGTASADNTSTDSGAVYVYKRTGVAWAQEAYIKASNTSSTAEVPGDAFGNQVALSGDLLAVSAPYEDSSSTTITSGETSSTDNLKANSGAVFVHRNIARVIDPDVRISASTATSVSFAWSGNLGSATRVTVASAKLAPAVPALCSDAGKLDLANGAISYTYTGLTSGTRYAFRFCSSNGTDTSEGTIVYATTK